MRTDVYMHVDGSADLTTARVLTTYHNVATAVIAYDPFVNAWLDGDTSDLAGTARVLMCEDMSGRLMVDPDKVTACQIDPVAYHDSTAYWTLDDEIDAWDRD